jgi:hypothetical protein
MFKNGFQNGNGKIMAVNPNAYTCAGNWVMMTEFVVCKLVGEKAFRHEIYRHR